MRLRALLRRTLNSLGRALGADAIVQVRANEKIEVSHTIQSVNNKHCH